MKVAAGALGAGQLGSRWGSMRHQGPVWAACHCTAGGLVVRPGEGLPMEMRAGGNYGVEAPAQRKGRPERKERRQAGGRQSQKDTLLQGGAWSLVSSS